MLPTDYAAVGGIVTVAILIYSFLRLLYNAFLHPLSGFPGPLIYRTSRLPYLYHMARGDLTFTFLPLHEKYGPVIRIAPDELSFTHPDAWKDIYGHRVGNNHNVLELPKARRFYRTRGTLPNIISEEDRAHHGLVRRVLSHGFSDQNLRARESVITGYADTLIGQLKRFSVSSADEEAAAPARRKPMNLTAWYNWVTVDIISHLTFGEPSGCLDRAERDPWIEAMNGTVLDFIPLQILAYLGFDGLINRLLRAFMNTNRNHHRKVSAEKVVRRVGMTMADPDLVEKILQKKDAWNLSDDEILGNAAALLIAGSETTATLLAGLTYLLCKHPQVMENLKQEVRSRFTSDSEITLTSVLELKYLLACLDEALRLYPPVPIGPLRTVPEGSGGVTIAGHMVPGGTDVAVWHWPMFHYSKHWERPMEYRPERFLQEDSAGPRYAGDMKYTNNTGLYSADRLDLLQPFNVGPRNCLGRNLAYSEMRLVLARMILNFDMELVEPETDWIGKQRADFLWRKGPLPVYLSPVNL
ncbi:hypothetical protein J7T55_014143 [Diaporthe amygdali]|uniref:uncharacterized protein n=1 Tax=Phomopsis amygdali TaxID=1214568 RepID=UPI0022FE3D47|nr:uncharacterized protein J7T55_014143 [Diaporthe amygdali]KAJ0109581.1 hypothetical protein J7T55_014143 [Diaporthe amygdali]